MWYFCINISLSFFCALDCIHLAKLTSCLRERHWSGVPVKACTIQGGRVLPHLWSWVVLEYSHCASRIPLPLTPRIQGPVFLIPSHAFSFSVCHHPWARAALFSSAFHPPRKGHTSWCGVNFPGELCWTFVVVFCSSCLLALLLLLVFLSGGWGIKTTWAQEFETSTERPPPQKNKIKRSKKGKKEAEFYCAGSNGHSFLILHCRNMMLPACTARILNCYLWSVFVQGKRCLIRL